MDLNTRIACNGMCENEGLQNLWVGQKRSIKEGFVADIPVLIVSPCLKQLPRNTIDAFELETHFKVRII